MVTSSESVRALSIIFMIITLVICFGVPLCLAIWAKKRYKKAMSLIPLAVGMLAFFVSQIVFRLPVIQAVLPLFGWYQKLMQMPWLYLLFLSFTAGLVEEPARFIAFSVMKKRHDYPDGLSYGIGHGGFEAIFLIGMTYISNIVLAIMINTGAISAIESMLPAGTIEAFTSTQPVLFLIAGIERIFAISLQIALSLVVLRGFQTNRKWLYLIFAFLLHGSANFIAVGIIQLGATTFTNSLTGMLLSEGFLLIVAVLSVLYIVKQAASWRKNTEAAGDTQVIA